MSYETKVDVPEGISGAWKIQRFTIQTGSDELFSHSLRGRGVSPGTYTRITRNGRVVMSDTDAEVRDHSKFIWKARRGGGRVLIHGLGIGMCLNAILSGDSQVKHVLVIEQSPDVIKLVASHYIKKFGAERVEIREGDAYTWKPEKGQRWTHVWHDIWDDLCTDNLPLMTRLHRRFGKRCDWQGSWGRELLEREVKEKKRGGFRFI